ncbi:MAG: dihydrolipoyl dehydrogenase [Alphaproteobacteria bacterium]|nr:dihydrolipoyl dehydrogenase [Alphaproteobacteria bacterium]
MSTDFDLAIIGSGPAGYVAAIRAAQLGLSTACIEKHTSPGGTCLNIGCIPSKALLSASEQFHEANNHLTLFGIKSQAEISVSGLMKHKDNVVSANTKGIEFLFKKNKVTHITGTATLSADGKVNVGRDTISARNTIWATGSKPAALPNLPFDEERVLSSTGALKLKQIPQKLIVIGAGYIGLELGCVWSRLGTDVTIIESLDRILPGMDNEISKTFKPILEKQGLGFKLNTRVENVKHGDSGVAVTIAGSDGKSETLEADAVLVAVGRKPNVSDADKAGAKLTERGAVNVNANFQTSIPNVYAVGDVIPGPMLAHKAEEEAVALVEQLAGGAGIMHYNTIPGIVYTAPEAASVGETEESLKEKNAEYKVGKFPFMANGRARAMGSTDGFVKILADKKTDRILGAHILGPEAGTLIHEVVLVMSFHGAAEDLARACHGHPTLNEVVREAALAVDSRAIHI